MLEDANLSKPRKPVKPAKKKPGTIISSEVEAVPGQPTVEREALHPTKPTELVSGEGPPSSPGESSPVVRARSNFLDLRPESPFRPPDYRWQIAGRLVAGELIPTEWIDRWVLLAEEVVTTPLPGIVDALDLKAVEAARELFERGPYWRRVEVEARLLAGESIETIAGRTGLTVAAIEAYATLFYAVSDRLHFRSYILHLVIGLYAAGADADVGVQVRLLGYQNGPFILDAVLDAVVPESAPGRKASTGDPLVTQLVRMAVGLRMTPVTPANVGTWARLYALTREYRAMRARRH